MFSINNVFYIEFVTICLFIDTKKDLLVEKLLIRRFVIFDDYKIYIKDSEKLMF